MSEISGMKDWKLQLNVPEMTGTICQLFAGIDEVI